MKKLLKIGVALSSLFLSLSVANADQPKTFLGPIVRGGFTSTLTDSTAYSLSGEAGPRNYRVGANLGWNIDCNQRLKLSSEYLWQKINYSFFSGDTYQWVKQGAVAADYQVDIAGDYSPQLDLAGYLSHAPSKNLNAVTGYITGAGGIPAPYTDFRRIAGSHAGGVSPGLTVQPWMGTFAGVDLNYDNVRYDTVNTAIDRDAKGLGGTARVKQLLNDNMEVGLSAAIRKPFNSYQANFAWTRVPYYGTWTFGINGVYTAGKHTLPSTYNVGLSADYFLDMNCETSAAKHAMTQNFLAWTADPILPQVLAIPDESLSISSSACLGGGVSFAGMIPNTTGSSVLPIVSVIPTAGYFTGSNLTFSMTVTPTPTAPTTITINPATGVISASVEPDTPDFVVIVTATNSCGAASSNAFTIANTYTTTPG